MMKVITSLSSLILLNFLLMVATESSVEETAPNVCHPNSASWTQWFNRDHPSGNGDYETLRDLRKENPGKICENVMWVEAQTLNGVPYQKTGEEVIVGIKSGFACINAHQPDGFCRDYKARFCCPKESPAPAKSTDPGTTTIQDCTWTSWVSDGKCVEISQNIYGIRRTRSKIPAKYGGSNCTGSNVTYAVCNRNAHAASSFVASFGAAVLGETEGLGTCAKDFYDLNGNLLLAGNCEGVEKNREVSCKTNNQHLDEYSTKSRDVLFLIDNSVTMGRLRFKKLLELVKEITRTFCGDAIPISSTQTRIGVATFSKGQRLHLKFSDHYDRASIVSKIGKIPYGGGVKCMIDALRYTSKSVFTKRNGARVNGQNVSNPGNEKFVFILTDRCTHCHQGNVSDLFLQEGKEMKMQGISVFTFLFGGDDRCTRYMQSLNPGSNYYTVARHSMNAHLKTFKHISCLGAWTFSNPCS